MPTKREREYYARGFQDGAKWFEDNLPPVEEFQPVIGGRRSLTAFRGTSKPKRKLSAWQKFVKANSRKKEFRYRDGKLNLKKMGVAYRRKKRR